MQNDTQQAAMPADHLEHAYGERRLAAAVLVLALTDLRGGSSVLRSGAIGWIRSGDRGALTFDFCCHVLDYNPGWMRQRLLRRIGKDRHHASTENLGFPPQRSWGLGLPWNF